MAQLTDDVIYPTIGTMEADDKFVVTSGNVIRKYLMSELQADLAAYLEAQGFGGIELDPPTLITYDADDIPPDDSWFGDDAVFQFFEFSIISDDEFVVAPPEVISGAIENGGVEAYIFPAADFVDGTIRATAINLQNYYTEDYRPDGVDGISQYLTSLPVGDYVLAVGCWYAADVGTVVDLSALLYGLLPVSTGLPDPGVPALPSYPLGVSAEGEVRPIFLVKTMTSPPRFYSAVSLGQSNVITTRGYAIGRSNNLSAAGAVAIGSYNTVSASGAVALGNSHLVDQQYSTAMGIGARPRWPGAIAYTDANISPQGNRQVELATIYNIGTHRLLPATPLPAAKVASITANVVTSSVDTGTVKAWKVEMVVAVNSGGTARIVGTPIKTVIAEDSGAAGWDLTVGFDASGLAITPTGMSPSEKTFANIQFVEV